MKLGLATRLTLLNAGIVALTCVGVVALMVTLTDGYMEAHVEESVIAELDVLVADYVIDGLKGVEGFIDIRQNFNAPQHGRVYRLESADGRHLAGGWPHWPARLDTDGSLIRVPNLQRRPATDVRVGTDDEAGGAGRDLELHAGPDEARPLEDEPRGRELGADHPQVAEDVVVAPGPVGDDPPGPVPPREVRGARCHRSRHRRGLVPVTPTL